MVLTQFIKDLLYLNDKLIIPGFGGFVAHYTPAQFNTDNNTLNPPGKYFIFDSTITFDDGVLATYLSNKKSISLIEANRQIDEMVKDFFKKLNEGSTLYIEEVGYFVLDDRKVIRFKREETINYHPESYGLGAVPFKAPAITSAPDEPFIPVKRKNVVVRILLLFLLLNIIGALSAFIYWKFDTIKGYFQKTADKKEVIAPAPDTITYQTNPDTTELGQYIDTSTNIKNALRYEETQKPEPSAATPVETQKIYYIIAGSFQSFAKAEVHAKNLTKQGLTPEIIEFSQELYRISVGEFKTKEEALKELETIQLKKGAEKAWLLLK